MAVSAPGWAGVRKVLCVRLDSLGDVLMCTPAMRALKQSCSGRSLTLLTSRAGAAAAPFIPEIDAVISYAAPWMKSSAPHGAATDIAFVATLRAQGFEAAVIFTSYSQSALPAALACYLAGIPLRLAHCRENPYQMLSDWIPDPEPDSMVKHEVRRQLDLVATVGCRADSRGLSFVVRNSDIDAVARRLTESGVDPLQPWIMLHPGASAPSRRYPPGHWAEVIRQLSGISACPIVLTGQQHEAELIGSIQRGCGVPALSLAGELSLGELGAAIQLARVVVCNNSGPAHMAAAIGTPLVDLYALTNPQHTPWQATSRLLFHDVPCRFCQKSVCPERHHDCLNKIDPMRVTAAICSLLAERGQK